MAAKNKYLLFLGCALFLAAVGYLDWITGPEFTMGPFYFIPIAIASWNLGRFGTLFFAFAVIFIRAFLDRDRVYTHEWLYYWNAFMRVGIFLTFAMCVRKISSVIAAQREIIKELSDTFEESWKVGGLFPVCTICKNLRTDPEYVGRVKKFVEEHSSTRFIHSVCPDCSEALKRDLEQNAPEAPEDVAVEQR